MAGYVTNIEEKSLDNNFFREVLFTGPHSQLVLMSLAPGEEIGLETHTDIDQFIRIEAGTGKSDFRRRGARFGGWLGRRHPQEHATTSSTAPGKTP